MSSHYPEDDEENLSENERHRRLNAQRTVYPASATPMRAWQPAPVPVRKPEPPLPDPPTQQRTLQIGVFFDGTGNNMANDRRLTDRDITNVVKLHDLYRDDSDYHRVYIHGVGTINGQEGEDGFVAPESTIGLALGLGAEGGHARIELALRLVRRILKANEGAEMVFDVFGFSRGAALARHFVNLLHRWPEILLLPEDYPHTPNSHAPTRWVLGFPDLPLVSRQVRFVGLFDTVGSFYLPGNDRNYDFDLSVAPGSARRVVHLTAHHEIRRNFPLSSLADAQGNLPGNFAEITLPGAHSDVGGGYENPEVNFANYEERVVRRRGGHGLDERTIRLAQMDAEKRGLAIRVEYPDVIEIERRAIRKELAIYALHQMHHEAQRAGVPLRDLDDAEPDHVIPAELQAIIDAWEEEGKRRKRQWMLDVSRERFAGYIHTSHRENSLPHAPEPSGVRQVYANAPSRSATPAREAQDA